MTKLEIFLQEEKWWRRQNTVGILKKVLFDRIRIYIMWHLNFFPHGNNCIKHRQENRSATGKQDTADIIHFRSRSFLASVLWNSVWVALWASLWRTKLSVLLLYWTIRKPPTPQSPGHYVFFRGLFEWNQLTFCAAQYCLRTNKGPK